MKWDEEVPEELASQWSFALNEIKTLGELVIPRCYFNYDNNNPITNVELIGFADSCLQAYGCCIYFKIMKRNGELNVVLVTSKSRDAPLKGKQTIPRLELMGMLLLARLVDSVRKCCRDTEMKFQKVSCYTDSMMFIMGPSCKQRI